MAAPLAVGDVVEFSETISASDIDEFAAVSGDENPVHLSEEYANETMFDGRIAHGMLGASYISSALARLDGLIIYLSQDLSFEAPIAVGTAVTVRVEVVSELSDGVFDVNTTVVGADGTEYITGSASVMSRDEPSV